MLLKDWLIENNLKAYTFAKKIHLSPSTIYKQNIGLQRISPRIAVLIEEATQGKVCRCEALWPEHFCKSKDTEVKD